DRFIGWEGLSFLHDTTKDPTPEVAEWIRHTVQAAVAQLYSADLVRDGLLPPLLPEEVAPDVISRLRDEAGAVRQAHHRQTVSADYKGSKQPTDISDEEWEAFA